MSADPSGLVSLRRGLAALPTDLFAALFEDAARAVLPATALGADLCARAVRHGVVEMLSDGRVRSRHRIRRIEDRLYLLELPAHIVGELGEYHQDIWPETDALLARLPSLPRGRLADVGCGSGVLSIEAAHAGHDVVATDLFPTALALTAWNTAWNDVHGVEIRKGDLFEPLAGERFDIILSAPHYTRVWDQLRIEVLRAISTHLVDGGLAVIGTFLEWWGNAEPAAIPTVLAPLGLAVDIEPIVSPVKRRWFTRLDAPAEVGALPSRHRFRVEIRNQPGRVRFTWPAHPLVERVVPLSRLRLGGQVTPAPPSTAVVANRDDFAALEALAAALGRGVVQLGGELPTGLLDACRFGARACVSDTDESGSAGAILDENGQLRSCCHGGVVGTLTDRVAGVLATQRALADAARERRGCSTCAALFVCPRCLFPAFVDETAYCNAIRRMAPVLPHLRRLWDVLNHLAEEAPPARSFKLKLRPNRELIAARGRPTASAAPIPELDPVIASVGQRWRDLHTWLVVVDEVRAFLFSGQHSVRVDITTAAIGELAAEGITSGDLLAYARAEHVPNSALASALDGLAATLTPQ
jgi:SAM-dependent methyltransferase